MPTAAIIFDFDGVLADSFDELYALNRDAMRRIGRPLTRTEYRRLFAGNIHGGLRRLIKDDAALTELNRFKKENFGRRYSSVGLFRFAKPLTAALSRTRRLGIVSSTRKKFIKNLLKKNGAEKYFSVVFGSTAHSKERELARTIALLKAAADKTYFVTDTAGDVKVGKKLGLRTVAVTWGFHGRNFLRKARPERICADERGLLRLLLRAPQ